MPTLQKRPTATGPRLPGLFFETLPSRPSEDLPRMDVAGFVGFAAAGPLDQPVPVEDVGRFRDVFGEELPLAWDGQGGAVRTAHLGKAVAAFFANGGQRAWVVRVADPETAVTCRFPLAGLVASADRAASPPPWVHARARSAGSAPEGDAVAATLVREPFAWLPENALPAEQAMPALELAAGAYRLDLAADPASFAAGDLLSLTFGIGDPELLLFVDRVEPLPGGVRLRSAPGAAPETPGAFWRQDPPPASPPDLAATTPLPLPVAEADGLAFAAGWIGSPPARLPAVRRLTLELSVFRRDALFSRLGGLAFARRHPLFWAALPTDRDLFTRRPQTRTSALGSPPPLGEDGRYADLRAVAAQPRFPLAGPEEAGVADYYLPWGLGSDRTLAAALAAEPAPAGTARLERDGLGGFGPGLFLDGYLAPFYAGALVAEAEHRYYLEERELTGLHSLLPILEVSLLAVPDAVHRGWSRELVPGLDPLEAPDLDPPGEPDAAGRYPVSWSGVDGATAYRVERDGDPAFPRPLVAYQGEATSFPLVLPAACPHDVWLRVRAERDGEVGPWSNTEGARLPAEDFADCAVVRPGAWRLALLTGGSPPDALLLWSPLDLTAPAVTGFELETAADAGFVTAERTELAGDVVSFDLPDRRPEPRYYRLRAFMVGGDGVAVFGPWSNTVRLGASERSNFAETLTENFDDGALLAVHRAAMRFAAARGDLLAVLVLPDHYRAEDALAHRSRLTPGGPERQAQNVLQVPFGADRQIFVPPLTAAEERVLSYAALYHPWLLVASSAPGDGPTPAVAQPSVVAQPPDGAIAGTLADVALARGAWQAPANRPLDRVLALVPAIDLPDWSRLASVQVNALLARPRGFLALSADTLASDESLRPIQVRRLLTLLRRLAFAEGGRHVFDPYDDELPHRLRHFFERLLSDLYRRGAFAGKSADAAFRVVTDASVNPPASVDLGRLVVELQVAPATAISFLTVRLVGEGPGRLFVQEV